MSNRNASRWWCKNDKAKSTLISFNSMWKDKSAEVYEYTDGTVSFNWDNWIYDLIIEELPLADYAHYRSDEFANYSYFCIGEEMFEGEDKNPNPTYQFDNWWVYKHGDKYVSMKRLMEMKDDFFNGRWRKYPSEEEEYISLFPIHKRAILLLVGKDEGYFKWLSKKGVEDD